MAQRPAKIGQSICLRQRRRLVQGRLGAADLRGRCGDPAEATPGAWTTARRRDLRGGAHGLGLTLLGGARVELQELILHGQLVPELRHLHRNSRGSRSSPSADNGPSPSDTCCWVTTFRSLPKVKACHGFCAHRRGCV